jgi:reactive intermediate/imine deaminase
MRRTFPGAIFIITILIQTTQAQSKMSTTQQSEKIVREFLQIVRSGREPERAKEFMADTVIANQMNAEKPETIKRTPQNYAEHIKDFLRLYGAYSFEITELIADNDKVYARWKQTGKHMADIDQYKATGLPLTEISSAVYRTEKGKIAEYWIQIDRQGFDLQLKQNENIVKTTNMNQEQKLPFTDAITYGEIVYLSGKIGTDSNGQLINTDFKTEAEQVMKNIGVVLQKQNLTYNDLLNVTIYLTSMDNYSATNEVYKKYFTDQFPARVCIAVKELPMGASIEIAAIAKKKVN